MLRRYISTAIFTGSLMFGLLLLAPGPNTLQANAIGVIALQWLALHRDEVRARWR